MVGKEFRFVKEDETMAIMVNHYGLDRMFVYGSGFMPERKQDQGPQKIDKTVEDGKATLDFSKMLHDMMNTVVV